MLVAVHSLDWAYTVDQVALQVDWLFPPFKIAKHMELFLVFPTLSTVTVRPYLTVTFIYVNLSIFLCFFFVDWKKNLLFLIVLVALFDLLYCGAGVFEMSRGLLLSVKLYKSI